MTALVITTDAQVFDVELPKGSREQLDLMYRELDCYAVDVVRLASSLDMWVDDEGAFTGVVNILASDFARLYGRTVQPYFGAVMLTGGADQFGNTRPLTAGQVTAIKRRLRELGWEG